MSDIEERLNRAKSLLESGKAEEARMALLEILKGDPKNPTALLMLGGVYYHEKKYAEAELVYERLIQSEPGSGMLSIAMFNTLWKQGRFDEAAAEIRRFIAAADKEVEAETIKQYAAIVKAIADGEFNMGE